MTTPRTLTVTTHPSRAAVQAIATAAAIMACADGHVARDERRTLVKFLRHHGILARYGRAVPLATFDAVVNRTCHTGLDDACHVADDLRAAAGSHAAPLAAHAAALVALADGVTWPQELAMLEVIKDRLGLRSAAAAGH